MICFKSYNILIRGYKCVIFLVHGSLVSFNLWSSWEKKLKFSTWRSKPSHVGLGENKFYEIINFSVNNLTNSGRSVDCNCSQSALYICLVTILWWKIWQDCPGKLNNGSYNTGSPQQKMSHMRIERVLLVPPRLIIVWAIGIWNVIIQNLSGYYCDHWDDIIYLCLSNCISLAFWNVVYFCNKACVYS